MVLNEIKIQKLQRAKFKQNMISESKIQILKRSEERRVGKEC